MGFVKKIARFAGGLLGLGIGGLFSRGKKRVVQPGPVTRDEAMLEADREEELARRRGARADRSMGGGSEPAGGLGRLIVGS